MDVSKLPKFSQTPPPPPNEAPPPEPRAPIPVAGVAAEAWLSIAIGAIVLLMQGRLFSYIFGGSVIITDVQTGAIIPYPKSFFFLVDLSLGIFGLALTVDGLLFIISRPWAIITGLVITAIATLMNLYAVIRLYQPMGLQLFPALAFALGVYIGFSQWQLLLASRRSVTMAAPAESSVR